MISLLWPETTSLTKFVPFTPISQGHFIDHLAQGPPSAPSPARASCDTNALRKSPATTPGLLLPNILLFEFLVTHQTLNQGQAALPNACSPTFHCPTFIRRHFRWYSCQMSLLGSRQLSSSGDKPPLLSCSPGRPHTTALKGVGGKETKNSVYQSCLHFQFVCCFSELPSNYSFRLYIIGIFI